jgi:hypothetical protein
MDFIDVLIDNFICSPVSSILYATNHTPNVISAYGTLFTVTAMWNLAKDDLLRFSLYFWFSYTLNRLEYYYAKKYDVSLNSYFYTIRNILSLGAMVSICYLRYAVSNPILIITLFSSLMTGINVGCMMSSDMHEYLNTFRLTEMTEMFGIGSYMLTLNMLIFYLSGGIVFLIKTVVAISSFSFFIGLYNKNVLLTNETKSKPSFIEIPMEDFVVHDAMDNDDVVQDVVQNVVDAAVHDALTQDAVDALTQDVNPVTYANSLQDTDYAQDSTTPGSAIIFT